MTAKHPVPDPTDRPCLSADEAFDHLGIDRTTGYRAIKSGCFPLPVIRIGRTIRIPTAALLELLRLETTSEAVRSMTEALPASRLA